MKSLLTTLLLSCALSVLAVTPTGLGLTNVATVAAATPAASGPTFSLHQNFEGTGYDNSETWNAAGTGTIDPDESTVVIAGSQSLQLVLAGQTGSTYSEFSAQSSVFCKCRFRVASTNSGNQVFATIRNGTTVLATFTMAGASRVLRATAAGGSNGTSTDAVPVDTDLYVWMEYVAGSGSNAIARIGWATTDSKPSLAATGARAGVSSNGTTTDSGTRFYLGNTNSGTMECFFDVVQVAGAAF